MLKLGNLTGGRMYIYINHSKLYNIILYLYLFISFFASTVLCNNYNSSNSLVNKVCISPLTFNPSAGHNIKINYSLRKCASITVQIFGPEGEKIKTIVKQNKMLKGFNSQIWDGKDSKGIIVPNEAYRFTITATTNESSQVYNPDISKWNRFDTKKITVSKVSRAIVYKLPKQSRSRIRVGIENGPLVCTLLDWKPKIAGEIMVHWDGWDDNKIINLWENEKSKIVITNIELPKNIIITYGNKKIKYIDYKKANSFDKNQQTTNTTTPVSLSTMISPKLTISFPMIKNNLNKIPVLDKTTIVRIDVEDKIYLATTPYEIVFFVDNEFYSEEPAGIVPYNWMWDITNIKPGEHIITVNLVSFHDQIGATSAKVIIR